MDIHTITDSSSPSYLTVAPRSADKVVLAPVKTDADPRSGDMMSSGSGSSQAGLIAQALISARDEQPNEPARSTQPERVLKPWGIAMLPDDGRASRQSEADAPSTSSDTEEPDRNPTVEG